MEFPEPVIEVAVEPKSKADQEKMGVALNRLAGRLPRAWMTGENGLFITTLPSMK